uniref:Uncharacterized protein n=1 Tax=Acrobeloides nanus TaxID=290746 RepID=A0A914DIP2_9BILA
MENIDSANKIFTVDEAIDTLGFGKFQIMLSLLTGFAWMADAMEMMILAFLSPALECEWNITKTQQALITTAVFGSDISSTYGIVNGYWKCNITKFLCFSNVQVLGWCSDFWCTTSIYFIFRIFTKISSSQMYCPDRNFLGCRFIANFTYYGITLFATVIYQKDEYCRSDMPIDLMSTTNTNSTIASCRNLDTNDYVDLLTTNLAEIPGLILTVLIIERIGRKWTMAVEFLGYSFCISLIYFCLSRNMVTVALFLARAFIAGAFQTIYVYTPEVYPTTLRGIDYLVVWLY